MGLMSSISEAKPDQEVTQLLIQWKGGSKEALDLLVPVVYRELRRLAEHYLRDERAAATLQPTAIVHEAYLRLVAQSLPDWESRAHFFGVAAHLMRQVLVDHARRRKTAKRGSGAEKMPLDEAVNLSPAKEPAIERLDDALTALASFDERKARVIELRFFGGFTAEEVAKALGISTATVAREQRTAEAWLYREVARARAAGA